MQAAVGVPTPTGNFTLTMTGKGWDKALHEYDDVSITLKGTRDGSLTKIVSLWVKGGNVGVEDRGTFAVSIGYGALVQNCHYIWMSIKMTGNYGGYPTVWYLHGKTGTFSWPGVSVSLFADKVILPIKGSHYLEDLTLKGTLTFT